MTPFDYINAINNKTPITWSEEHETDYVPFIVNKGLGQFIESVQIANELNIRSHLSKRMQFEFAYGLVPKGKRFSKWAKGEADDTVDLIASVYGYSKRYASTIIDLFTPEQLEQLKERVCEGGRK